MGKKSSDNFSVMFKQTTKRASKIMEMIERTEILDKAAHLKIKYTYIN